MTQQTPEHWEDYYRWCAERDDYELRREAEERETQEVGSCPLPEVWAHEVEEIEPCQR